MVNKAQETVDNQEMIYRSRIESRASRRRLLFFTLTFIITAISTLFMADLFWRLGFSFARICILILFCILIWQISFGAMHALFGVFSRPKKKLFDHITKTIIDDSESILLAETAILLPICNEETKRVYEGLRSIYNSIEKTKQLKHFDFFILSDSTNPDRWVKEESFWLELCQQLNAFGRIFYRRRENHYHKKAGNVADFLRTWGKRYKYMICLDADSLMSGDCIVNLVKIMEKNPSVGICQTAPAIVRGESLYARMMQFASHFYGPVFQAGLNYWQQNGGNFWGHNAILRIDPFMEYCALPKLPGKEPFGGKILSHDFVEAALMRKAGWFVWLAYDYSGSYEEGPPDLIESAKRDRRWCQGNLQHTWLVLSKGFFMTNRIHMLNGIMSYAGSLLWFIFLLLSSFVVYQQAVSDLSIITVHSFADFINLSVTEEGFIVFGITIVILLLPKFCCLIHSYCDSEFVAQFGGRFKVTLSVILETLFSALVAPLLMMFHSKFVVFTLFGKGVGWGTQNRSAKDGIAVRTAIKAHWKQTFVGCLWAYLAYLSGNVYFWWISPIFISLIISIPFSIILSKVSVGSFFKDNKIFQTPPEVNPSPELLYLEENLNKNLFTYHKSEAYQNHSGLLHLITDPYINALHVTLLKSIKEEGTIKNIKYLHEYGEKLLTDGIDALSTVELNSTIKDPDALMWLHHEVWLRSANNLHVSWCNVINSY